MTTRRLLVLSVSLWILCASVSGLAPPAPALADDGGATVASRTPDVVPPTPELARLLARFDGEADPGRALKRAFVSTIHYLLARDLERLLPHFHPDLRLHEGSGDFRTLAPDELRAMFSERMSLDRDGPRKQVERVVDLDSLRAYSRAGARDADKAKDGFETDPREVARVMGDDDWLVIAHLLDRQFGQETFYVFRRDGERWKVVVAE